MNRVLSHARGAYPTKAILVGMTLDSFMKWYANFYFHIPPSFSSVLLMPMSNQASCLGDARQALMSQHCNISHNAWATTDSQSQATMKCSSPLSSSTTSPLRPRFRAGAHCSLEVFSTPRLHSVRQPSPWVSFVGACGRPHTLGTLLRDSGVLRKGHASLERDLLSCDHGPYLDRSHDLG